VQTARTCIWHEKLPSATEQRLNCIENAVNSLNDLLSRQQHGQATRAAAPSSSISPAGLDTSSLGTSDQPAAGLDPSSLGTSDQRLHVPLTIGSKPGAQGYAIRQPRQIDVVSSGFIRDDEARIWFRAFFEGCDRFVPVFDPTYDTYSSVKRRSNVLFDVIVTFGCRSANGSSSKQYQRLYRSTRQHNSDLVLSQAPCSIEMVQAMIVLAFYSESGTVLGDVAIRAAIEMDLPGKVTALMSACVSRRGTSHNDEELHDLMTYACARIWYGLFVLDQILSLDGGKPPTLSLDAARRVKAFVAHPYRTALDLRLFAQVELNALRALSYEAIVTAGTISDEAALTAVDGGVLDLDLWKAEWQALMDSKLSTSSDREIYVINLEIQHAWGVLCLQLRALSEGHNENVATMTPPQHAVAVGAKYASQRHLDLLLTGTINGPEHTAGTSSPSTPPNPYLASLRYATSFVWAKNVFCALIMLRLCLLLDDPLAMIVERLQQVRVFMQELENAGTWTFTLAEMPHLTEQG
jgi:hypothetical protein